MKRVYAYIIIVACRPLYPSLSAITRYEAARKSSVVAMLVKIVLALNSQPQINLNPPITNKNGLQTNYYVSR